MKNVILILGILTTVMVCGVVAGVSDNAAPEIDMDLNEDTCRICHVGNLQGEHHSSSFFKENECSDCHEQEEKKSQIVMDFTCGLNGDCHNTTSSDNPIKLVTDHHDFTAIFDNDDWDCLICHEKGVPRPLDN
ncbi:MAG: hypothetical protein MIO93_11655 [ANME-2 cluster archaeon]|jgi:hypothetical protein|nr:hypothetical protein [ANME-2 cluster archaeon]